MSQVTCLQEHSVALSVSWVPGETFYGEFPDTHLLRYFLRILDGEDNDVTEAIGVTDRVRGELKMSIPSCDCMQFQRNVTLEVRGLNPSSTYKIKVLLL